MKKDNIGKKCRLKVLKKLQRTSHGGLPTDDDFIPLTIMGVYKGGYIALLSHSDFYGSYGGYFKVKTNDIIIID
jgi:hypothetical protein